MDHKKTIKHEGIVEEIGAGYCTVRILQASACSSCSARQLCRSSESKEKVIDIKGNYTTLNVGDTVTLVGTVRQGLRASLLAYVVPLILMLTSLFAGAHLGGEAFGALSALMVLAAYYALLYLLRNKIGKHFYFEIETNQTK